MIETHDLAREYGPKVALSGLNLRVEPGEILGFPRTERRGQVHDGQDPHRA